MKALALVMGLALALPASADEAALVPRVVTLSEAEAVAAAKRIASCEAKVAVYEARPSVPVAVVIAVAAALVGGAVGAGVTYAATRPK